jgi:hypothetical protein
MEVEEQEDGMMRRMQRLHIPKEAIQSDRGADQKLHRPTSSMMHTPVSSPWQTVWFLETRLLAGKFLPLGKA